MECSNDFLYQLYRRCAGSVDDMLLTGIPNLPSSVELQKKAKELLWPQRMERDGVVVDFSKVELLKQRETQIVADLITRMDQSLLYSRKRKVNRV